MKKLVILFSLLLTGIAFAQYNKPAIQAQINSQFPDQNTGQITPATTRAFLTNILNSWQQYAGFNKQVGAAYQIQLTDYGQIVTFNNGGAVAVTLSPASATGFTAFNVYVENITTGNVVVTPQLGTTICGNTALTLVNAQRAWIISDGTNYQCEFSLANIQITNPLAVANGGTGVASASGLALDNITGFSGLGWLGRTAAATYGFTSFVNGLTLGNVALANGPSVLCYPTGSNQSLTACNGGQVSPTLCVPQRQLFTSGSVTATYTTPSCNSQAASWLEVDIQGGGAGGGGSGTVTQAGTAGNATTFGALTASGGSAPAGASVTGGVGGACSGTLGTQQNFIGSNGNGVTIGLTPGNFAGGRGGVSFYGGYGASPPSAATGINATANSGGGGSGGSTAATAGVQVAAGGGAGCHIKTFISSPAATIALTVGNTANGGAAGTSGFGGGQGAAGLIDVRAHWQ